MAGQAPQALNHPEAYAVQSGGWVAHRSKPLDDVMVERFGNRAGVLDLAQRSPADRSAVDASPLAENG